MVNDVASRNFFSVPCIEEGISSLCEGLMLSTLDAEVAICKSKSAMQITSEKLSHGIMGCSYFHARGTFHCTTDVILLLKKWEFVLVYFDDIIKFSGNADEHISHVCTVPLLLHKGGVTMILEKCISSTTRMIILRLLHGQAD